VIYDSRSLPDEQARADAAKLLLDFLQRDAARLPPGTVIRHLTAAMNLAGRDDLILQLVLESGLSALEAGQADDDQRKALTQIAVKALSAARSRSLPATLEMWLTLHGHPAEYAPLFREDPGTFMAEVAGSQIPKTHPALFKRALATMTARYPKLALCGRRVVMTLRLGKRRRGRGAETPGRSRRAGGRQPCRRGRSRCRRLCRDLAGVRLCRIPGLRDSAGPPGRRGLPVPAAGDCRAAEDAAEQLARERGVTAGHHRRPVRGRCPLPLGRRQRAPGAAWWNRSRCPCRRPRPGRYPPSRPRPGTEVTPVCVP